MKKNILMFMLGVICTTVIGVGASVLYKAEEIKFTPSDSSWNVTNVGEAINYLKNNKQSKLISTGTASSGSTINFTKGNLLVVVSTNKALSSTNLEVVDDWKAGPTTRGVNSWSATYRILDDSISLTIAEGWNYVYYELG